MTTPVSSLRYLSPGCGGSDVEARSRCLLQGVLNKEAQSRLHIPLFISFD